MEKNTNPAGRRVTQADVVFPTAIEPRAGGFDVFYGMADTRIGVAHLTWHPQGE